MKDNNNTQGVPDFDPFEHISEQQKQQATEAAQQYKESKLGANLSQYFKIKPYYIQKKIPYNVARTVAVLGHTLSVLIGLYLALKIGGFLFSWLDTPIPIFAGATVGGALGAAAGAAGLVLWELLKNYKFRTHYKNKLQFPAQYNSKKQLWKLLLLLSISMSFNGYGGFEAVRVSFGDAPTAAAPAVNIADKVQHLRAGIAAKDSTLNSWEKAQQQRTANGEQRMYKLDKEIITLTAARTAQETKLDKRITHWEQHNEIAGGKTASDNTTITAAHEGEKLYYAILCALVALVFDLFVISCLWYCEHYKHKAHKQLAGAVQIQTTKITENVIKTSVNNIDNPDAALKSEQFEININKGVPFITINDKNFTLRAAKQRLSVSKKRIADNKDANGTNAKNRDIFAPVVVALQQAEDNLKNLK